jgi:hypothetical protein
MINGFHRKRGEDQSILNILEPKRQGATIKGCSDVGLQHHPWHISSKTLALFQARRGEYKSGSVYKVLNLK